MREENLSGKAPSRNAPCPCGSGKKYKHCCALVPAATEGGEPETVRPAKRMPWFIGIGLLAFVGISVFAMMSINRAPPPPPPDASWMTPMAPGASTTGAVTPEPWHYDAVNNRHWDPGHGHWHQGPPPMSVQGGRSAAPEDAPPEPEAWHYDAAQDRHWDPDHGHWHQGPPPARE